MDGVTAARHIRASAETLQIKHPYLPCRHFSQTRRNIPPGATLLTAPCRNPPTALNCTAPCKRALAALPDARNRYTALVVTVGKPPTRHLATLMRAAAREINHLILAYGSCREGGDIETALHCRKAIMSVAASFEITGLRNLLKRHDDDGTWPSVADLICETKRWNIH